MEGDPTMINKRIVFMGTPEFATGCLQKIKDSGFTIAGVVTVPDKPAGRGQKVHFSSVKQYAMDQQLPLLQPEKLRDPEFLEQLASWNADLFVVVAFRMLPQVVWKMPALGTINLHASLLPQYRGAAPINWAIMNGEKESGVTTFFIREEIDSGNIIQQRKVAISDNMTAGELHDELMKTGSDLLVETLDAIFSGSATSIPQENLISTNSPLKEAPKIFKDDCRINWNWSAEKAHNHIRGLSPYPAAFTEWEDEKGERSMVKIFKTKVNSESSSPGLVESDGKKLMMIGCSEGKIEVLELQAAGKKRMSTEEFLRGSRMVFPCKAH